MCRAYFTHSMCTTGHVQRREEQREDEKQVLQAMLLNQCLLAEKMAQKCYTTEQALSYTAQETLLSYICL